AVVGFAATSLLGTMIPDVYAQGPLTTCYWITFSSIGVGGFVAIFGVIRQSRVSQIRPKTASIAAITWGLWWNSCFVVIATSAVPGPSFGIVLGLSVAFASCGAILAVVLARASIAAQKLPTPIRFTSS
ncbi:MAG: hypothetical protein ACKOXM_07190, partial [Agromyces sp.]